MELNIEIIKEFINLEELHSSKSNPRTYLSLYQGAAEELLKNYMKQKEEIKQQKQEIEELKVINNIQKYRIGVIDERELISKDKIKELLNKDVGQYMKFYRDIEELLEE